MRKINYFVKKVLYKLLYLSEFGTFYLMRLVFKVFTNKTVIFGKNETDYTVTENGLKINIAIFKRFRFYHDGLKRRLDSLAEAYGIHLVSFGAGDVVVDCGANIGEVGCYLQTKKFQGRYIAIEPDDKVNQVCKKNNIIFSDSPLSCLLSDEDKTTSFYLSSCDADSSAIIPDKFTSKIEKEARKLDTIMNDLKIERVKLFKLEAEGYEPEVLRGVLKTLEMTNFVAIDCGPERQGKDTIVECFNVLFEKKFKLVFSNFTRGAFLFENSNFKN